MQQAIFPAILKNPMELFLILIHSNQKYLISPKEPSVWFPITSSIWRETLMQWVFSVSQMVSPAEHCQWHRWFLKHDLIRVKTVALCPLSADPSLPTILSSGAGSSLNGDLQACLSVPGSVAALCFPLSCGSNILNPQEPAGPCHMFSEPKVEDACL